MRSINEILIIVKKQFNKNPNIKCLCECTWLGNLTEKEQQKFRRYLYWHKWNFGIYYSSSGSHFSLAGPVFEYLWPINDLYYRNKWLDKHIKRTSR